MTTGHPLLDWALLCLSPLGLLGLLAALDRLLREPEDPADAWDRELEALARAYRRRGRRLSGRRPPWTR